MASQPRPRLLLKYLIHTDTVRVTSLFELWALRGRDWHFMIWMWRVYYETGPWSGTSGQCCQTSTNYWGVIFLSEQMTVTPSFSFWLFFQKQSLLPWLSFMFSSCEHRFYSSFAYLIALRSYIYMQLMVIKYFQWKSKVGSKGRRVLAPPVLHLYSTIFLLQNPSFSKRSTRPNKQSSKLNIYIYVCPVLVPLYR